MGQQSDANIWLFDLNAVERLVVSAAHASECELAGFYRRDGDSMALVTRMGGVADIALSADHPLVRGAEQDKLHPTVVLDSAIDGWPTPDESTVTPFAVLVPLVGDNAVDGLLVLGSLEKKKCLSAAQYYVLGSIAAQMLEELNDGQATANHRTAVHGRGDRGAGERLRLLESAVVNARDSILITEAEPVDCPGPRIVYCNPAFTQTTGYTEAEVLNRTPRILQGPLTDRVALDKLKAALKAWRPVEVELTNYRKDGTPFWVELSIVPVADEKGWFTHWVSVQRDTSERKAAEAVSLRVQVAEKEKEALAVRLVERQRAEAALVYAATHDELTQLHNRAFFIERLSEAVEAIKFGNSDPAAVLFLDLDGFKLINDTLGHATGDAVLVEVAERLSKCLRESHTLARLAGDEFVILVEDVDEPNSLQEIAERINALLRYPIQTQHKDISISCSVGAVRLTTKYNNAGEVLRDADAAMYAAKRGGNGGFRLFRHFMHERALEALSLQADLKGALKEEQFDVHYQPIYDAHSRQITSVEALVRWTHPTRGSVSPSEFIPVAEHIGVIGALDHWVMETAMSQAKRWQAQSPERHLRLNINVSALELTEETYVSNLMQCAREHDFSLSDLQLEITEGVLLDDSTQTEKILSSLRAKGVRIALDDFGTGYSSLAYIDRYQLDTLKIDRSFVSRMLNNRRTMAILKSTVSLAGQLELGVVAEGVETEDQINALCAMGCGQLQGYLLCKPLPASEFTELLKNSF